MARDLNQFKGEAVFERYLLMACNFFRDSPQSKSRSRATPASSFCLSAAQLVPPRAHWSSALHDAGASGREEVSWLIRSGREPTRLWLFSSLCLCLPGESLPEQTKAEHWIVCPTVRGI